MRAINAAAGLSTTAGIPVCTEATHLHIQGSDFVEPRTSTAVGKSPSQKRMAVAMMEYHSHRFLGDDLGEWMDGDLVARINFISASSV